MLLEYNQDTVDEKMVPRAIELRRRVAGRKLAQNLEEGIMNADDLLMAKEMNRDELKEHTHEQFTVTMAGVHARISVARAEQQLTVHQKVRALEKDVARASRLGKSRMDALTDLESRLQNMRAQLQQPIIPPPDVIISRELRASNKTTLEKQFDQCPKCNRRILVELLETHKRMCQHKNVSDHTGYNEENPIYNVNQDLVTSIVTFAPQMPRNCQVTEKGATFIQWVWEPPVIDGGLTVTEYEISYLIKISDFDKATGKYKKSEIEVPSLKTSLWCFADNPVCNHGYRMTGLRAGTEYTDFRLRCYNLRGWSPWMDMIPRSAGEVSSDATDWKARLEAEDEARKVNTSKLLVVNRSVFTNPPEPPSGPLFVTVTLVTSSCIHFHWQAPWYDGGSEIVDYVIRYTELEKQLTVTARDVIVIHERCFETHSGTATSAVIRNIFSDIDVINLSIEAVNKAELHGERIPITYEGEKVIHTAKASRFVQLNREMAHAQACKDTFIDSAFFTGVRQRLLKVDFMRQLAEELSVTTQDEIEMDEAKEWAAVQYKQQVKAEARAEAQRLAEQASVVENDSIEYNEDGTVISTKDSYDFTYKQRRRHFRVKIASLENLTKDLTNERKQLDKDRSDYTLQMKAKEKVLLSYKLEYERLKHYTGQTVTSSVLTGSNMQYLVADYREKIDKAFDMVISEIGKLKYKVINNESRKQKIKVLLVEADNMKKDRQAKFLEFENNYQKSVLAMERLNLNAPNFMKLMRKYFVELKNYKLRRQAKREQVTQLFNHVIFRYKRSAFSKWKMGEFHFDSSDTDKFISVGSILLQQSCEKRIELQGLLRGVIAETAAIKQNLTLAKMSRDTKKKLVTSVNFKLGEEGLDHRDLHSKGMHFLYEGDGYAMENKFSLAQHNYEAQIWSLRAQPRGVDIKLLAICHGRLGKMFLQLGKTNRAIVEFDRQLSLAREISDKAEEADGYYGLGSGYLDSYDYENAARYLIIASTMFEALDNGPKYCGALILLKDCFGRLGKDDKVEMYSTKIEAIENDLKNKLKFMNTRLEDFKVRLTSTAAEIEHVINIERMTVKALGIKHAIEHHHTDLKDLEGQVKAQEDKIGEIEALLDAIAAELSEAIETDEPEMMSHLVHDQPQVIEVEELKVRLAAKSATEQERLQQERVELKRLNVLVSNCENTIRECDQQLTLENGALMKHSQLDKPFRFIGLCQSNTAGNEVTGTATGGFEEFAAAEGCNIHMIDYHSGALNYIFAGEVKNKLDPVGHTAVVTVLCHDGALLYSGSADELIICWNTITKQKVMVLRGHEGTIVAIAVETNMVVSSAADATLRLWDKHTGAQMRVLFGHSKSVLSIEIGPTWLLTGSADHEVRLWKIFSKKKHHVNAECQYRLIGHECIVTCVRYGKMEIVSGDEKGRIFIWWVDTGKILRRCNVHKGPVKCMQFDTVHIVSGGVDNTVAITDIATGEVLQSLHGHTGHVLALAFDTERILSASGDNTVRYWQWGKKADTSDKYHVFDKGETLVGVGKLYGLDIDTLMLWNGIQETKQCYVGMKLLVRKGDPDVMTDAEKAAAAREKRRLATMNLIDQKLKKTKVSLLGGEHTMQYDRVHKLATDIDFYSLGNRLFGREKRQNELFPDAVDINSNSNSLASRINRANAISGQENYGIDFHHDPKASKLKPRYFINADNEEEWGEVSDSLGVTMLAMMIEYTAYEVVMEQKRMLRSNQSVVGRTNAYQKKLAEQKAQEAQDQLLLLHGQAAVAEITNSEGESKQSEGGETGAAGNGEESGGEGGEGVSSKSSSPSKKNRSKSSKKEKSGGKSRKSTKVQDGEQLAAVPEVGYEEAPSTAQDSRLPPVKVAVTEEAGTSSKSSKKQATTTTLPPI